MDLLNDRDIVQVAFQGNSCVKKVILNRPHKLNALTYEMSRDSEMSCGQLSQMMNRLEVYENDSKVRLVILKGNGRAFCAGGDVVALYNFMTTGHWSFGASFFKKFSNLEYLVATYKKPLVALIDGMVMGGGAGVSMLARFKIVTENTVFAMPAAAIGSYVGETYFLSRLPGYFGEYLGLTGARLDGAEMIACGLATHFVRSKEKQIENGSTEKWMVDAINSMKSSTPTGLKLFLRSIREGRRQNLEECLVLEYTVVCHVIRRTMSNDFYEGVRSKLIEKDTKPEWKPSKLELVEEEKVDRCFERVYEDDWEPLQLSPRSNLVHENTVASKL
ncbi:hypothetical protein JRO89_XS09G0232700 [Xanthoceras sorbifolium]|uniref:3-hydroxyisobutyryl-CoA hydrolase n=1 Tax=Xanthoceras sorbifolium TaxID=99658 RepID=A0ABQ8HML5_9ROSI|nr:hypothetical protein JRO89_XS09G0232700 [Xanthoceras sorbifolium]